ncbi:MAG TPA: conjugal transfer protein TraG N-terminal domain-containing protein [Alphaproteobacteria bacterium]|nr:conjugal transfer protein TraG N-terminal domain-containing protein [Alphaproteobacteria bacterium]
MNFTVVTYGAGEVLSYTFNAIAAILNSQSGSLYQPLVRLGLTVGLLWATAAMVYGDKAKFIHNWLIPFYLALALFFAPTCTVYVQDPVTGSRFKVDNVPWGLGMVAGTISQIGDKVTREIEKTFSLPDDLKYHKTGAVMASNLIASARTFQITNEDLAETLRSFVNQCVVYDALMGVKYTLDELRNSPDIWRLATEKPSPARCFTYKEPGRGKIPEIVTCQKGAALLDRLLKQNVQNAFQFFESKVFGTPTQRPSVLAGNHLRQYLPGAFNYMTNMAKSAEEHMLQQMMIYSVIEAIETKSTALGNAPNFAVRKAYLQQRANQETLAGIAAQKLIAMKNMMEAIIYAAFIFILPMALLPQGWSFISRWIQLVMWIQLWPPLYAILNFIMNVSLRSKGMGLISTSGGITIGNSVGFMNLHADMASQAGFMSIAVGALAYAIVKGGTASFVHLASHLSSPSTSAAAQASESLMSGNYSFGNVSSGTVQAFNTTFGQHLSSPSYASGAFSQNDGDISRTTTSGEEHIVSISNSNLRSNIQLSESMSQNYTEQATEAHQMSENKLVAATQAQAEHNRSLLDLSEHQARQNSESENHSTGNTVSTTQAFNQLDSLVDRFAKDHSISKDQASQIIASASAAVETGVGFSVFGTGVTAKATGAVVGQFTGTSSDRDLFSAAQDYSQQSNFQKALNQASQAAHDLRHSDISDEGKRYVSSLNASSEKTHQLREEASVSFQKSEAFSKMASWTQQNAGSINANLNQEYVNWLQAQALPNSKGSMGITEAETILSSRPDLDHAYQQRFLEQKMQQMESQFGVYGLPNSPKDIQQTFQKREDHLLTSAKQDSGVVSNMLAHAKDQGFGEEFKFNTKQKNDVKDQLEFVSDQLMEQKDLLTKQEKAHQTDVEKYTK